MRLQIITPGGVVRDTPCRFVLLPLVNGAAGVLPGHAPLLGTLEDGTVRYECSDGTHYVSVSQGTVHVAGNEVTLLVSAAEPLDRDN